MGPKRKGRPYENKAEIIKHFGFGSEELFDQWRNSKIVKPHWDRFRRQFLESIDMFTPGRKVGEFSHIYTRIIEGEKNGGATFSMRTEPKYDNDIDWHAWLLFSLVDENTVNRNGCFYGRGFEEIDNYRSMWNFIAFEKRQRARANKASKSSKTQSPNKPNPNETSSSDDDEPEDDQHLDPTQGVATVLWSDGIPEELEDEVKVKVTIKRFYGHSKAEFRSAVEEAYGLRRHGQTIVELEDQNRLTYRGAQLKAHRDDKRACFIMKTTPTVDEDEGREQPLSETDLPALPGKDADAETRQLHWLEMLADASDKGASTFDVNVRLWRYNLMKAEATTAKDLLVMETVLNIDDDPDTMSYTLQLPELTRLLSDQSAQDSENTDGYQEHDSEPVEEPPLSEIKSITDEQIAQYRQHNEWLDNTAYQPDDHETACQNIGISNPELPTIAGVRGTRTFKFYQPVAIDAMIRFEDSHTQGGILGEDMGLGKTVEMIGVLLVRSNQRRESIRQGRSVPKAQPTLILMPKILISQWKDEILSWTDRFTVVVYYGVPKKQKEEGNIIYQKDKLTRSSGYFNGDEKNSDVIILSSYTTYGGRHGPKVQQQHFIQQKMAQHNCTVKQAMQMLEDEDYDYNGIHTNCPFQLSGLFIRVILDEGHEFRGLSPQNGTAVIHTAATYRHIMTGTPTVNALSDIGKLMYFLQNANLHSTSYLRSLGFASARGDGGEALQAILETFDPWTVREPDPRFVLRFSEEALNEWVFSNSKAKKLTSAKKGERIIAVLRNIMVRRSYASSLGDRRLDKDLPSVQRMVFECEYTDIERQHYDAAYANNSSALFSKKDAAAPVTWSTSTYRRLCLLTSWLGFHYLLHYKVQKLRTFRKNKGDARQILKDLRESQTSGKHGKGTKLPAQERVTVPKADAPQDILERHCIDAPKLRKLLSLLAEITVLRKENAVIWVNTPAQMEWLSCVLKLCGIDARQLLPDLTAKELSELMRDFTTKGKVPMVLICSYMVGASGLNMQYNCRTMVEFEPPPNESVRQQALARLKRTGNPSTWVRHISLLTANSFNTQQDAVSLLKSLPFLSTQLNRDIWGKSDNSGEDDEDDEDDGDEEEKDTRIVLGDFVLYENELYQVSDPHVAGLELKILDSDTLLLHIQQKLLGRQLTGDAKSLDAYVKHMKKTPIALDPKDRLWR